MFPHLRCVEEKRGHDENSTACDWWKRPCGRVNANAQSRRVTSVSQAYLSFLSNVPSTRLSHVCVCVRDLVSRLQTSSFLCFIETQSSTMVKLAKVRAEFVILRAFSAVTFNRLCCVRARGLLRKVAANRQNKIDLRLRRYETFYNGKYISYAVVWRCPRGVACMGDLQSYSNVLRYGPPCLLSGFPAC